MHQLPMRCLFGGVVFVECLAILAVPRPAAAEASMALQRFAALTVAQAETAGVEHSPDVEAARAAVDDAAAALAQARGVNGVSALIGYTSQPQGSGQEPPQFQQRLGTYQLQTTLGDVQAYGPLVVQATAALAQSITDEQVAERTEKLKVVGLYYTALQARVQRQAKDDALAAADDFESHVRDQYTGGTVKRIDLLRAQVATAKARADQATAQAADANATDALAREIARPAGDLADLLEHVALAHEVLSADIAIARALAFRPEIASADKTVEQAEAGRRAALRSQIPPITLTGGYENGDDSGTIIGGPMVTASTTIPLSGVASARVHVADAAIRAARAHRDGVTRALAIEVGAAARSAAFAIIASDATAQALDLARSELALAMSGYKESPSSGITVRIAQDIYNQAVSDNIAALYAEIQAQATLDVEMGTTP